MQIMLSNMKKNIEYHLPYQAVLVSSVFNLDSNLYTPKFSLKRTEGFRPLNFASDEPLRTYIQRKNGARELYIYDSYKRMINSYGEAFTHYHSVQMIMSIVQNETLDDFLLALTIALAELNRLLTQLTNMKQFASYALVCKIPSTTENSILNLLEDLEYTAKGFRIEKLSADVSDFSSKLNAIKQRLLRAFLVTTCHCADLYFDMIELISDQITLIDLMGRYLVAIYNVKSGSMEIGFRSYSIQGEELVPGSVAGVIANNLDQMSKFSEFEQNFNDVAFADHNWFLMEMRKIMEEANGRDEFHSLVTQSIVDLGYSNMVRFAKQLAPKEFKNLQLYRPYHSTLLSEFAEEINEHFNDTNVDVVRVYFGDCPLVISRRNHALLPTLNKILNSDIMITSFEVVGDNRKSILRDILHLMFGIDTEIEGDSLVLYGDPFLMARIPVTTALKTYREIMYFLRLYMHADFEHLVGYE